MGKIELKKQKKEKALLDAAYMLFTTKGIHKTSISDIVENSGVAKGTFYLYFKDKYDISRQLTAKKANQLFLDGYNAMDPETIVTFEDRVIFVVGHILDALSQDHDLLKFISRNLVEGLFMSIPDSEDKIKNDEFTQSYLEVLDQAAQKYRDPRVMLYTIIELTGSASVSPFLYGKPVSAEVMKEEILNTIRLIMRSHELPKSE